MHLPTQPATPVHTKTKPVKRAYEPGMKVTYDPSSKRVIVAFRGRITVLQEAFETEAQGVAGGELHCRALGWTPNEAAATEKSRFRALF